MSGSLTASLFVPSLIVNFETGLPSFDVAHPPILSV
jgi:hypothetical protein